jgi:hypothetical protein
MIANENLLMLDVGVPLTNMVNLRLGLPWGQINMTITKPMYFHAWIQQIKQGLSISQPAFCWKRIP